jgi:ABC-type multidrug transport system ATPase subunit
MPEGLAPALRLVRVSKAYADGTAALSELSLEVPRGLLVGLLGPNGSGKSTLLRLCAGALRPSAGHLETFGFAPHRARAAERGRIAFADQDVALDPEMTGRETFELLAALNRLDRRQTAIELAWVAESMGLGPALERRVSGYSGGMRRRLHVALSLLPRAELLLLDEPFVGLDAETRERVWASLVQRAASGATILISTHELFDVGVNCAQVAVLNEGRLLTFTPPRKLIERYASSDAHPHLESAYLRFLQEDRARDA